MTQIININGPVNIVRLQNKTMNKIIHIAFDLHYRYPMETQCDDLNSIDIDKFLLKRFNELQSSKTQYDFFFETFFYDNIDNISIKNKDRYIEQINRMLHKLKKSGEFKNIRFHLIDPRGQTDATQIWGLFNFTLDKLVNTLSNTTNNSTIDNILHNFALCNNYMELLNNIYTSVNNFITNCYKII